MKALDLYVIALLCVLGLGLPATNMIAKSMYYLRVGCLLNLRGK